MNTALEAAQQLAKLLEEEKAKQTKCQTEMGTVGLLWVLFPMLLIPAAPDSLVQVRILCTSSSTSVGEQVTLVNHNLRKIDESLATIEADRNRFSRETATTNARTLQLKETISRLETQVGN